MQTNKVIQGDCLEVMKDIPDKSVDMICGDNNNHIAKVRRVGSKYPPITVRIGNMRGT